MNWLGNEAGAAFSFSLSFSLSLSLFLSFLPNPSPSIGAVILSFRVARRRLELALLLEVLEVLLFALPEMAARPTAPCEERSPAKSSSISSPSAFPLPLSVKLSGSAVRIVIVEGRGGTGGRDREAVPDEELAGPAVEGLGGGTTVGGPRDFSFCPGNIDKDFLWDGDLGIGGSLSDASDNVLGGGNSKADSGAGPECATDVEPNDEDAEPGEGLSEPFRLW